MKKIVRNLVILLAVSFFQVTTLTAEDIKLSSSGLHTIQIRENGNVFAWGDNQFGQLGIGNVSGRVVAPVAVVGLTEVVSVATGSLHSIALKSDGSVWAWGGNSFGELGNGTRVSLSIPTKINTLSGISTIITSGHRNLALKNDGTLWMWGFTSLVPEKITGLSGVVSLNSNYALKNDGTLYVHSLSRDSKKIAGGFQHSLSIGSDTSLWAWGSNETFQLASPMYILGSIPRGNSPSQVNSYGWNKLIGVTSVTAGQAHSLALKTDGTLWAWGANGYGQIGNGTVTDSYSPTQVLTEVVSVSAGANHTLAIRKDGTLWAWGANGYGVLGLGTNESIRTTPTLVLNDVVSVATGYTHSLILRSDGTVWSFGSNIYGQLGNGNYISSPLPVQVRGLNGSGFLTGVTAITAGNHHSLALRSDGTLYSWGHNEYGQLGDGSQYNKNIPQKIISEVISFSAGEYKSLAIKKDGSLWTWGSDTSVNSWGLLDTINTTISPVHMANEVSAVAAGWHHSIIIRNNLMYNIFTQGRNDSGELGYVSTSYSYQPVPIVFDVSPPIVTTNISPNGWTNKSVSVLATGYDTGGSGLNTASYEWSLNGTTWLPGATRSVTVNGPVSFRVRDNAGNYSAVTTVTVTNIDMTKPTYELLGNPTDVWTKSDVVLTANRNDTGGSEINTNTYMWSVNGGEWLTGTASKTISTNGLVKFHVTDAAGNQSEDVSVTVSKIDKTEPSYELLGNPTDMWTKSEVVLTAIRNDIGGSEIDTNTYMWSVNGGEWLTGTASKTISTNGLVKFHVTDAAGNQSEDVSVTVSKIDKTKPIYELLGNPTDVWTKSDVVLTANRNDTGGSEINTNTYMWSVNGGEWLTGTASKTISTNGLVKFHVTDAAGNQSEDVSVTVSKIDKTKPIYELLGNPTDVWTKSDVVLTANRKDTGGSDINTNTYMWSVTDGIWVSGTTTKTISTNGTVKFHVTDAAGNQSEDVVAIVSKIDKLPPLYGLSSNPSGITNSDVLLTALREDVGGSEIDPNTYKWSVNGGGWISGLSTKTISTNGPVSFQVKDTAGNLSPAASLTVTNIDKIPPNLSAILEAFVDKSLRGTVLGTDEILGSGLEATTWRYWFDTPTGSGLSFTPDISGAFTLDIQNLTPGPHSVYFQVQDKAGNLSTQNSYPFTVDRTPPSVSALQVFQTLDSVETELTPVDLAFTTSLRLQLSATDMAGTAIGEIDTLVYKLSPTPLDLSTISGWVDYYKKGSISYTGQSQTITLANGVNYIYVLAKDSAGNISPVSLRQVRVDNGNPSGYSLVALTHPKVTMASEGTFLKDAIFTFQPGSGASLREFQWELWTGSTKDLPEGTLVKFGVVSISTGSDRLELLGLEDTPQGMFSILRVRGVGFNHKTGTWITHSFRVDTTAPKNLSIQSWTHGNPEITYPLKTAKVFWLAPTDLTGIKSYYYRWTDTPDLNLPQTKEEKDLYNLGATSGWTATLSTQLESTLGDLTSASGQKYLQVCAEDYPGNRQFDQRVFNYDSGKPTLGTVSGPGTELVAEAVANSTVNGFGSATISWGTPADNLGVESLQLRILKWTQIGASGRFEETDQKLNVSPPQAGTHTFTSLPGDNPLMAEAQVKDRAGNIKIYQVLFRLDNDPIETTSLEIPFQLSFQGYRIEGVKSIAGVVLSAVGYLPAQVNLKLTADGTIVDHLVLDPSQVILTSEGEFLSAQELPTTELRSLTVAGFTGNAVNLGLDVNYGLSVGAFTVQQQGREHTYDVALTYPPQVAFGRSNLRTENPAITLTTQRKNGVEPSLPAWNVDQGTLTTWENQNWVMSTGRLSSQSLFANWTWDFYQGTEKSRWLSFHQAKLNSELRLVEARPVSLADTWLEMKGSRYKIIDYLWKEDRLTILRAEVQLGAGFSVPSINMDNFSLTFDGSVIQEPGFTHGNFTYTDGEGIIYTVNNLGFDTDGGLIATGSLNQTGTNLNFTKLRISETGPSWDLSAETPNQNVILHGFPMNLERIKLKAGGVLEAERATFTDFLGKFGGGAPSLTGLSLRIGDLTILTSGTNAAHPFVISGTDYLGNLNAVGLALTSQGLFASQVTLTGPTGWTGNLVAHQLLLNSNGTLGSSALNMTPQSATGAGFPLTLTGLQFVTDHLVVQNVSAHFDEKVTPQEVSFGGLTWNAPGILQGGVSPDPVMYAAGDWNFQIPSLKFDSTGIHGSASLTLPGTLGGRIVDFTNFKILPSGTSTTYESGTAAGDVFTRIHGWNTELKGFSLTETEIHADKALVRLYSVMGDSVLEMPNLVLGSDGTLVSCEKGTLPVEFRATNGFWVKSNSYQFNSTALALGGSINLPSGMGSTAVPFGPGLIALNGDGSVTTELQNTSVSYSFGAIGITGSDFWFDRQGVFFDKNTLNLNNLNISLPLAKLGFYADGSILFQDGSFPGFNTSLFGCEFAITGVSLEEEGLAVRSFITLPAMFKGVTVYFDPLIFHPDGRITSETAIPELPFEIEGVQFLFKNIRFAGTGFTVGEAVITLPASLESKQIRISGVKITPEGDIEVGSLSVDPLELFGYTFYLDDLNFSNGVIGFVGRVRLPDTLPAGLGGRVVGIRDFRVTTAGEVLSFEIVVEGTYDFPLAEGWTAHATGIGIKKDSVTGHYLLAIETGTLDFPSGILPEGAEIGSVTINGLTLDPTSGIINFSKLTIDKVKFTSWGVQFLFDIVSVNSTFDFTFSGSASLPNDTSLPPVFRGKVLNLSVFEISHTGVIGKVEARLTKLNGAVFEGLSLTDGTLSLVKAQDVRVGVSGTLTTGSAFPQGLAEKTLTIKEFEVNVSTLQITKLDAELLNVNEKLFGAFSVVNGSLSIKKTDDGFIVGLGGKIKLPGDLPGILANQELSINTCKINTNGTLEEFSASLSLAGENTLFEGVLLKDGLIKAEIVNGANGTKDYLFTLGGSLKLGSQFPEGLAGAVIKINEAPGSFTFSTAGGIKTLDISAIFPDSTIMGVLPVRNGNMTLKKESPTSSTLTFGLSGTVLLPSNLPAGLAGKPITIQSFKMDTTGKIIDFNVRDAGAFDFFIAEGWKVHAAGLGIEKDLLTGHHQIVLENGTLDFPAGILPNGANIGSVAITGLKIDTVTGKVNFTNLTMNNLSFTSWGIQFLFNQVSVNNTFDFTFKGSATLPITTSLPEVLRGQVLNLSVFEISHTGVIGNVNASLSGLTGAVFEGLSLTAGTLSLVKAQDVRVGVSGTLNTGPSFPQGLDNKVLTIKEFEVNVSTAEITKLDAELLDVNVKLFGSFSVARGSLSIKKTDTGFIVGLGGAIVLPGNLPPLLANKELTILKCKINTNGTLEEFSANLNLAGENELFTGLTLKDGMVSAAIVDKIGGGKDYQFTLGGTLKLGSIFPSGLAGTEISNSVISFTTGGGVQTLDVTARFSDTTKILGVLPLKSGVLSLKKESPSSDTLIFGLEGSILLPDSFPSGLAGKPVSINRFKMNTKGEIIDLEIATSGLTANIFGYVGLENGSLSVSKVSNSELLFTTSGDLVLPADKLPPGLAGKRLEIKTLQVSTTSGLVNFSAGLKENTDISFELFAGIQAKFKKISLSTQGFDLQGAVIFPSSFPLKVPNIDDLKLAMTWNGVLTDLEATLSGGNVEMAGFQAVYSNLQFNTSGISIGSLKLTLPKPLQNYPFELLNAGFRKDGSFYGTAKAPSIETDLVGFKFFLRDPTLNVSTGTLGFSKAGLKAPAMMGGAEIALNNVSVSKNGVNLGGGEFSIPDFSAGPGLGFRKMKGNFVYTEGAYRIDAQGECAVPGIGTFFAQVSFINQSAQYPIGLKRAYMTYTLSGLGLPIMTTGMYLNQIRGGLAFGPPDELPPQVRHLFTDGTRLELGVGIIDGATAGKTISAQATLWIDITNVGFAFKGEMLVLSGLARGELIAALTKQGFYGMVKVEIVVAKGMVEIWVYGKDGKTLVAGNGWLQFGIRRGTLLNIRVDLGWFGSYGITIPDSDWWTAAINAQFGHFKNNRDGIKGWITNVPMFGTVGAFVPYGGGLEFANVGDYVLDTPSAPTMAQGNTRGRSESGSSVAQDRQGTGPISGQLSSTGVSRFNTSEIVLRNYRGRKAAPSLGALRNNLEAGVSRGQSPQRGVTPTSGLTQNAGPGVERLIFILGIPEGDPILTAVSPSGRRYTQDSPEIETFYQSFGVAFVVKNPEPGDWSLELTNVVNPEMYKMVVMGVLSAPELTMETPAQKGQVVSDSLLVQGSTLRSVGLPVTVYASQTRETFVGQEIGTGFVEENGKFSIHTNLSAFSDGEYFIYAGVGGEDDPELQAYATGSVMVVHTNRTMEAVTNLRTSVSGDDAFELWFNNPNGDMVKGYHLSIDDTESVEVRDLGDLNYVRFGGYEPGTVLTLTVNPYDKEGEEGPASTTTLTIGPKPVAYSINWSESARTLEMKSGQSLEGTLRLETQGNWTGGAFKLQVTDGLPSEAIIKKLIEDGLSPKEAVIGLSVSLDRDPVSINSAASLVPFTINTNSSLAAGEYLMKIVAVSTLNAQVKTELTLTIKVTYPSPLIETATPNLWKMGETPEVTIYGDHFIQGTRVLLDGQEVPILERQEGLLRFNAPGAIAGGEKSLILMGPDGQSAQTMVTILEPTALLVGQLTEAVTGPGSTVTFAASVEGQNGFDKELFLSLNGLPAGWTGTVTPSFASVGSSVRIEILPSANAVEGIVNLSLVSQLGHSLPLTVQVQDGFIAPVIKNISEYAGYPGDELILYGSGFGNTPGTAALGTIPMSVKTWAPTVVKVLVPSGIVQGTLKLTMGDVEALGPTFNVKTLGFDLKLKSPLVKIGSGEILSVPLQVMGYANRVDLEAVDNAGILGVALDKTWIKPNGGVTIRITVPLSAPAGNYWITLTGRSGTVVVNRTLNVKVGEVFEIITDRLPDGLVDAPYLTTVKTQFGEGKVYWKIKEGQLPLGLILSRTGEITGKPSREEKSTVTLEATDELGNSTSRVLSINITLNLWSREGMDRGESRFNPVAVPGNNQTQWISKIIPGAKSLWTGRSRIYVLGTSEVALVNTSTGQIVQNVEGNFVKGHFEGDKLYLLDKEGNFQVRDGLYGTLIWERPSIKDYASLAEGLILFGEDTQLIDPLTGDLKELKDWEFRIGEKFIEAGNTLYRVDNYTVDELTASGWSSLLRTTGGIWDAAADASGLVVTGDGKLWSKDSQGLREIQTGETEDSELALSPSQIITSLEGKTILRDRISLETLGTWNQGGLKPIIGEGKVLFSSPDLRVMNPHSNLSIWTMPGITDGVLAGGVLYALDSTGHLLAFNGPVNASSPVTTGTLSPGVPNGTSQWYKTQPLLNLNAQDRDGFVQSTKYKIDEGVWTLYTGSFLLPEGDHIVRFYSTDDGGWEEQYQSLRYKADFTAPEITWTPEGILGQNGWYIGPVTLTGTALDSLSGIKEQTWQLGEDLPQNYLSPVTLNTTGTWATSFIVRDQVGLESTQSLTVPVDLIDPEVTQEIQSFVGLTSVRLKASDVGSGVKEITYKLDLEAWKTYTGPVWIKTPGTHNLEIQSKDQAGRTSIIQKSSFIITDPSTQTWIKNLEFSDWKPGREVVRHVVGGEALYSPSQRGRNKLPTLPAPILGADYIRLHTNDDRDEPLISFIAGVDLDIYVARHRKARNSLPEGFVTMPGLSLDGRTVWKKSFNQGEQVNLNAPNVQGETAPDWIFAQYSPSQEVMITKPSEDQIFTPGQTLNLEALAQNQEISPPQWSIQWGREPKQNLGTGWNGETSAPWTESTLTGKITLSAMNDQKVVTKILNVQVENKSDLDYSVPRSRMVAAGQTWNLRPLVLGVDGQPLAQDKVTWTGRFGFGQWLPVQVNNGVLNVPTQKGIWTLKAVVDLGNGHTKTLTKILLVMKRVPRIEIYRDHQYGDYWDKDGDHRWSMKAGEGSYLLRVDLGTPWRGRGSPEIRVNGVKMNLNKDRDTWTLRINSRGKIDVETSFDVDTMTFEEVGE